MLLISKPIKRKCRALNHSWELWESKPKKLFFPMHTNMIFVLPQVAAQAHRQLQVSKLAGDNTTRTSIRELGDDERIDELARMLGGMKITKQTREHAREMLEQGQQKVTRDARSGKRKSGT